MITRRIRICELLSLVSPLRTEQYNMKLAPFLLTCAALPAAVNGAALAADALAFFKFRINVSLQQPQQFIAGDTLGFYVSGSDQTWQWQMDPVVTSGNPDGWEIDAAPGSLRLRCRLDPGRICDKIEVTGVMTEPTQCGQNEKVHFETSIGLPMPREPEPSPLAFVTIEDCQGRYLKNGVCGTWNGLVDLEEVTHVEHAVVAQNSAEGDLVIDLGDPYGPNGAGVVFEASCRNARLRFPLPQHNY